MKTIISQIPSREALIKGEDALKIGYPWLALGAIIALESIINKQTKVLELGSGGSTIFWANNCKSVKSYETNLDKYNDVKKKTRYLRNVEITLCDRHGMTVGLKTQPKDYYDIILLNSDPARTRRLDLANLALPKIKPGGWLVINNYAKFGMGGFNYSKKPLLTFDELGFSGFGTKLVGRT
jgi:hypothetical protein